VPFSRRFLPLLLAAALAAFAAETAKFESARGTLIQRDGKPAIETPEHKIVWLSGDDAVTDVLNDERLRGVDFEALGNFAAPDHFQIAPSYQRPLFVHKDGKRLMVTYWCGVCHIRTYKPGDCWCCHKYTDLDLRESVD
jgi:hypothetical protein